MKHSSSGFTLIELMIVVALMGILATVAIGTQSTDEVRVKDLSRALHHALVQARAKAVSNQNTVVVSLLEDRVQMFSEHSMPKDYVFQEGVDKPIHSIPPPLRRLYNKPGMSIQIISGLSSVGGNPTVIFGPDGLVRDVNGELVGGVLEVEDAIKDTVRRRRVSLTIGGSARLHK